MSPCTICDDIFLLRFIQNVMSAYSYATPLWPGFLSCSFISFYEYMKHCESGQDVGRKTTQQNPMGDSDIWATYGP